MVPLIQRLGLVLGEGVGEDVVPLLGGVANGAMVVGGVTQDRKRGLDLREGDEMNAFGGCRVDRDLAAPGRRTGAS